MTLGIMQWIWQQKLTNCPILKWVAETWLQDERLPVAYYTQGINPGLAKQPLNLSGGLSKPGLTL